MQLSEEQWRAKHREIEARVQQLQRELEEASKVKPDYNRFDVEEDF